MPEETVAVAPAVTVPAPVAVVTAAVIVPTKLVSTLPWASRTSTIG